MKRVKTLKRWGIYQLNEKEIAEYGFTFAPIHPEIMDAYKDSGISPEDADWECNTLEEAISWINNYKEG